jgi:hypothetical protein
MSARARSKRNSATAHAALLFPMRRIEGRKLTANSVVFGSASEGPRSDERGDEGNSYIALCLSPFSCGCTADS